MKASMTQVLVAAGLIARVGRQLTVLTLPLICWLAGQSCPTQMLVAWAVQRATALLAKSVDAPQAIASFGSKSGRYQGPIVSLPSSLA